MNKIRAYGLGIGLSLGSSFLNYSLYGVKSSLESIPEEARSLSRQSIDNFCVLGSHGHSYFLAILIKEFILALIMGRNAIPLLQKLAQQQHFDINCRNQFDFTLLMIACHYGAQDVVATMIKHPFLHINLTNNRGMTALMIAVTHGHIALVKELLTHPDIIITHKNHFGHTASQIAIAKDHYTLYPLLRAARMKMLLYKAIRMHDAVKVRSLLATPGIEINMPNLLGYTPLALAAIYPHPSIIQMIMDHPDIDINGTNGRGETALMKAVQYGNVLAVELLLSDNRTLSCQMNQEGTTALLLAAQTGHELLVKKLAEHEEKALAVALTLASHEDDFKAVNALLYHSAVSST